MQTYNKALYKYLIELEEAIIKNDFKTLDYLCNDQYIKEFWGNGVLVGSKNTIKEKFLIFAL